MINLEEANARTEAAKRFRTLLKQEKANYRVVQDEDGPRPLYTEVCISFPDGRKLRFRNDNVSAAVSADILEAYLDDPTNAAFRRRGKQIRHSSSRSF